VAVTSRELIIAGSLPAAGRPWQRIVRTVYVPRWSIQDARVRAGELLLRSGGADVQVRLRSRAAAAAASSWLGQLLGDHDRSGAGSWPDPHASQ
jgi:hypothetical protein